MENIWTFILLSILLVILPGPDYIVVTKNTLKHGTKEGFQTLAGSCTGLLIHTFLAIVGLSAIIVKSAVLFSIFKVIGAAYLIYLGFSSIRSMQLNTSSLLTTTLEKDRNRTISYFREGLFTNVLNPKVAVFFLTFLPQFVNQERNTLLAFSLLGFIYIILTILFFALYIPFIDKISAFMQKPSTQKAVQGISGAVLIIFGVKLLFEKA